jgi:membrane dipeptidase
LLKRGFSERDLAKIASRNALRAMREVELAAERLRQSREPALGRLEDYQGA